MKFTTEEIENGISTIRSLRQLAAKGNLTIHKATSLYQPKYRLHWGRALKRLGVVKLDESTGQGHVLKSYWNQAQYPHDYDLLMAIFDDCKKLNKGINQKHRTTATEMELFEKEKANAYISFDHLSMTENEYLKLCDKYSILRVDDIIDRIKNYKKNKKYKSLYLTAKNWLDNDLRNNIENYWQEKEAKQNTSSAPVIEKTKVDEMPKTKWLKIFGIKIYEKPVI